MTSVEHLVRVLDEWIKQMPLVKILYEHQKAIDTHVIQVETNGTVDDNFLKAYEERITFDFIKLFPSENIFFVTEDSYTRVHDAQHVFVGASLVDVSVNSINWAALMCPTFDDAEYEILYNRAAESKVVYSIQRDQKNLDYFASMELFQAPIDSHRIFTDFLASTFLSITTKLEDFSATERGFKESNIDNTDESNYAMAA